MRKFLLFAVCAPIFAQSIMLLMSGNGSSGGGGGGTLPTLTATGKCAGGFNGCTVSSFTIPVGTSFLYACESVLVGKATAPTDSLGNTYLPFRTQDAIASNNQMAAYYVLNPTAGTTNIVGTTSGGFSGLSVEAWNNVNTSSPFDTTATNVIEETLSDTSITSSPILPTFTNVALLPCMSIADSANTFTSSGLSSVSALSYAAIPGTTFGGAGGYQTDAGGTSQTVNLGWTSASTNKIAMTLALKGTGSTAIAASWVPTDINECNASPACTTPPMACGAANFIAIEASNYNHAIASAITITDSLGNTWNTHTTEITGTDEYGLAWYYKYSPTTGNGQTFTITDASGSFPWIRVHCFKRTSGATPGIDVANAGLGTCYTTGTGATCQAQSLTPAGAGELMLTGTTLKVNTVSGGGYYASVTDTNLPPALLPIFNPVGNNGLSAWNITTGTAAVNPTWTLTMGAGSANGDSTQTVLFK